MFWLYKKYEASGALKTAFLVRTAIEISRKTQAAMKIPRLVKAI